MILLLNAHLGAPGSFTGEILYLAANKLDDAIFVGVNSKVAADVSARTSNFCSANLTYDNLTSVNFLTTENLDAEALTGVVMDVFGRTARFNMRHTLKHSFVIFVHCTLKRLFVQAIDM